MINNKTLKNGYLRFVKKRMRRAGGEEKNRNGTNRKSGTLKKVSLFGFAEIIFEYSKYRQT